MNTPPPVTPHSIAFAEQMALVAVERKNAKQCQLDVDRSLELIHIKAQNACNTVAQRSQVQLAWNNHGAGLISLAELLDVFAECGRAAAADPQPSRAESDWNEQKRAPIWPTFKG